MKLFAMFKLELKSPGKMRSALLFFSLNLHAASLPSLKLSSLNFLPTKFVM